MALPFDPRGAARWSLPLLVLGCTGCFRIPFVKTKEGRPLPPLIIERFAREAATLGALEPMPLAAVTRTMASAVDTLPAVAGGEELSRRIRARAETMAHRPEDAAALARPALDDALTALRRSTSRVSGRVRDEALASAERAIAELGPKEPLNVAGAYVAVAGAMVHVTGGQVSASPAMDVDALVARLAAAELDDAGRIGAEVVHALSGAARALARPDASTKGDALDKPAARLSKSPALDFAPLLKQSLSKVAATLDGSRLPPASRRLLQQARRAVEAIRIDRPFDLQRAIVQDAVRLLADALTVAGSTPSAP
jgi:hypothetical protein